MAYPRSIDRILLKATPLPAEERARLLAQIQLGDRGAKRKFIFHHLRFVAYVVMRLGNLVEQEDAFEEAFQEGVLSLYYALRTYKPEGTAHFGHYALPIIKGDIVYALGRRSNRIFELSDGVQARLKQVLKEMRKLQEAANDPEHVPSASELAAATGFREETVLGLLQTLRPVYDIFITSRSEENPEGYDADVLGYDDNFPERVAQADMVARVRAAIEELTPKQKRLMEERYFSSPEVVTHVELAKRFKCVPQNVSIMEQLAVRKLQAALAPHRGYAI